MPGQADYNTFDLDKCEYYLRIHDIQKTQDVQEEMHRWTGRRVSRGPKRTMQRA